MEFRLLGEVAATVDGCQVDLGRRRERCLLALLLLDAGRPVGADRLVDLLWDDPPAEPRKALTVHISRLRRTLAAAVPDDSVQLVTTSHGYALPVDPELVDLHRFEAAVDRARRCADPAERARLLHDALALWQGPALPELTGRNCEPIRARLDEMRLDAIELRVEADLATGRHRELIGELATLAAEHPGRDRLIRARLLALYRAGRKTDALHEYQHAARRLVDELGVDPSPELRDLHVAMIRDDSTLAVSTDGQPAQPQVHPAELPASIPTFTGRDHELSEVIAAHTDRHAPWVVAIDGMAGVGKTALAVRAAHQLATSFPDGQLYLDLRGCTAGVDPLGAGEALERLLSSLGITGVQVPSDVGQRAALYRSVLADRQMLIVLDDALSAEQVRPLLPGAGGCLVLVTSRQRLSTLDQARHVSLSVLPHAECTALFTRIVGAKRLVTEPAGLLDEVVELCGRLPLALRIAAARLHSRPTWSLGHLLQKLRDERGRLTELHIGERSVAGAFHLSYEQLDDDHRRLFRLAGLHPGTEFDVSAAAALVDATVEATRRLLDDLLDVHLLEQRTPERYQFHDLLRSYATERALAEEPEQRQVAASTRLLDWYLQAATTAAETFEPVPSPVVTTEPSWHCPSPSFAGLGDAIDWFATEHQNLVGSIHHAAKLGLHRHAWQLTHAIYRYLHLRCPIGDWLATHQTALRSVRLLGDRFGEAETLTHLATAYGRSGHVRLAIEHLERALPLYRELGLHDGEARALNNLGAAHTHGGQLDLAIRYLDDALQLRRACADEPGEARTLNNLGRCYTLIGRLDDALALLRRALAIRRKFGDSRGVASTLVNLGLGHVQRAAYDDARACAEDALDVSNRLGDYSGAADAHNLLGEVNVRDGNYVVARQAYELALTLSEGIAQPVPEAQALNGLGECHRRVGDHTAALEYHERALDRAERAGDGLTVAHARRGAGLALLAAGEASRAGELLAAALDSYVDLRAPEAAGVRVELASLTAAAPP